MCMALLLTHDDDSELHYEYNEGVDRSTQQQSKIAAVWKIQQVLKYIRMYLYEYKHIILKQLASSLTPNMKISIMGGTRKTVRPLLTFFKEQKRMKRKETDDHNGKTLYTTLLVVY